MSNWDVDPPNQANTQHVNANLNQVSSASGNTAASAGCTAKKIIIAVVSTCIIILGLAAIGIPLALALTRTGPFSTTTTYSNVSTNAGTTLPPTTVTTVTTQSTTISTVTTSTVTTSTSTATTATTASSTVTTTSSFSLCSSYTSITDATRLTTAAGGSTCDQSAFSSTVTWVRFSGAAGTRLTTSAPSSNLCDTQATGWYSGSLPSSGVSVNGTVCYVWSSNNCNWSNMVQVTNCGSFYVFGLIAPPVCNLRYCTA